MNVDVKVNRNPTYDFSLTDVTHVELNDLIAWMANHTDPTAPNVYKELLVQFRKAHETPTPASKA